MMHLYPDSFLKLINKELGALNHLIWHFILSYEIFFIVSIMLCAICPVE